MYLWVVRSVRRRRGRDKRQVAAFQQLLRRAVALAEAGLKAAAAVLT